jgi:hypothetical protein
VSDSHEEKEPAPRNSTNAGRHITFNDEQPEKVFETMQYSFDPDSNVNDERDVQDMKELSPRNLTEAGTQIECNEEHPRNADSPIRVSFEPDSNINEQSESQEEKLPAPRISIVRDKVTLEADPKYRITEMPSKLSRKSP